jgi:class 3 adenylate cyclase
VPGTSTLSGSITSSGFCRDLACGRANYTLVGDPVNVTAPLEQMCKEIESKAQVTVLFGGDLVALAKNN